VGLRLATAITLALSFGLVPAGSAVGSRDEGSATGTIAFVSGLTRGLALAENGLVQRPLVKTRDVTQFAWSPSGRQIAFVSGGNLHVINADGSGLRRLAAKPILSGLAWSPDSRKIAYTAAGNGSVGIFVLGIGGGRPKVLAPSVPGSVLPSWSRRGPIAFTSAHSRFAHIYTVEADGTRLRMLTRGPEDSWPLWSPDGRLLLFQRNACQSGACGWSIQVMRANGSERRPVVFVPQYPGSLSAAWSPDGRRIVFQRRRKSFGYEIVRVDMDGRHMRVLAGDASSPAWSPDGRRIAYASDRSVYVMSADGSGKRLLVDLAGMPAWQPDG
jgi:Tol biopolymer transport system component